MSLLNRNINPLVYSILTQLLNKLGCLSYQQSYVISAVLVGFGEFVGICQQRILRLQLQEPHLSIQIGLANFNLSDSRSVFMLIKLLEANVLYLYKTLTDIVVLDMLGTKSMLNEFNRFSVNYIFFSYKYGKKLTLAVPVGSKTTLFSLTSVFSGASWQEREVWDMFGIKFFNNNDLRRILTDYGFRGFPLRKDFPTVGFKQVRYDEKLESVTYENLVLMQEERENKFINPWAKSTKNVLTDLYDFVLTFILKYKINFFLNKIWKI